ncbi:ribonuclease H2 subunit C [Aspergillus glaucus CBS 516.65]|uniref:Uncharacterized protein n=1 Tax=Aspergillus glaucus CBS 516.65 TaxID=1160497 RepID=A0A1L9VW70_ASPGL|nr:hypothetical protein ASPGLDRAFT_43278 [Aspergillus glaucus CBS 516.65]OJJ88145.1 hypothetical protein ASPGLDRAFT_43278 [Aspergillus glaucus CBS 516.65]
MFAIRAPQKQSNGPETENSTECCTPNILPCRIHHDGPVDSLQRYWAPAADNEDENLQISHFRGRKLRGRRVAIPDGYQGVVAMPTERVLPSQTNNGGMADDADMEPEEPVKVLENQGTFDEFVVWKHDEVPGVDDVYVKGVEEWLKLAEVMHSSEQSTEESQKKAST